MLCPDCRRQLPRSAAWCAVCGRTLRAGAPALELVLPGGARVPLDRELSLGRSSASDVQLSDPSVSRRHATFRDGSTVEDAGSSHGTWVDGQRISAATALHDGASLRIGDVDLTVERARRPEEAGRTVVAPVAEPPSTAHPRARGGWTLKRLEAAEGERRHVLRDLRSGRFLRLDDFEAAMFPRIDGSRGLSELIGEAEREGGPEGPGRLATLLATLGDEGFLAGIEPSGSRNPRRRREWALAGAGDAVEAIYAGGGFALFARPALVLWAAAAVAGVPAFIALIAREGMTPFVVAGEISLGAAAVILGRLLLVVAHELAHALTVASFGRRVTRAGFALLYVFPIAFVDTTEAWLEPRRRRLAITAAGPLADLVLAGACALLALAAAPGTAAEVLFQVAFAGYLGALANLLPLPGRDGRGLLGELRPTADPR